MRDSTYLQVSIALNTNILDLYAFVDAAKHETHPEINFLEELSFSAQWYNKLIIIYVDYLFYHLIVMNYWN